MNKAEIERRYSRVRAAMAAEGLDALVVSGSEYSGFEGSVLYMSGFLIVHRYAYVVLPLDGDPAIVFPSEARYVGKHDETWIEENVFVDQPGAWIAQRAKERGWKRLGVYGLDYVMTVRDYRALEGGPFAIVPFDVQFDHARAVKSQEELASVRESVRINTEGFRIFAQHAEVGRTEAEILAVAEKYFVEQGCGRATMDMVLVGEGGRARPEFLIASTKRRIQAGDLMLPSLEVAGSGGHWVEVSRALCAGEPTDETKQMLEAYQEYFEAARRTMKAGATAHDVHTAVSKGFHGRGWKLGHVTGHSIGMTMIEFPKIGEGVETVLEEDMVISMHPHVISADGTNCLYMQDTWRVGKDAGEAMAGLPMEISRI